VFRSNPIILYLTKEPEVITAAVVIVANIPSDKRFKFHAFLLHNFCNIIIIITENQTWRKNRIELCINCV
jgi:hypothetical protein